MNDKQVEYQANYAKRQQAARKALGVTLAQWQALPRQERQASLDKARLELGQPPKTNAPAGRPSRFVNYYHRLTPEEKKIRYERQQQKRMEAREARKLKQRAWYQQNKAKLRDLRNGVEAGPQPALAPEYELNYCPNCRCNLRAVKKAMDFVANK